MSETTKNKSFDRSKIYEKLDFVPEPSDYSKKIPWLVQLQIAATNGIQYQKSIGKLNDYPKYNLPVERIDEGIMLDIGTGWGRWLVAGQEKGYIPIGLDLRLEFCKAALQTMKAQNKKGYVVAGDLKNLPFKTNIFDLVWSFSVIQHTCEERLNSCLNHIERILNGNGFAYLEFPNKEGIRNSVGPAKKNAQLNDDYNSWHVRYYRIDEYKRKFEKVFQNFEYDVHSFMGIGVLPEDLKYVSLDNKLKVFLSLLGTSVSKIIPGLKGKADSIYVRARKNNTKTSSDGQLDYNAVEEFKSLHKGNDFNNLHVVPLLRCPISGGSLKISENKDYLISISGGIKYPIVDGIPVLIDSEAVKV